MDWILILKYSGIIYLIIGFCIFIYGVIDDIELSQQFPNKDPITLFQFIKAFLFLVFVSPLYLFYLIFKSFIDYLSRKLPSFT